MFDYMAPDGGLGFSVADMEAAIRKLNIIPVRMDTFLTGVQPRICGLPSGFDAVTQRCAQALNKYGASVVAVTVHGMSKIPATTSAYANVSQDYQATDTQNANSTTLAAGGLLPTALANG